MIKKIIVSAVASVAFLAVVFASDGGSVIGPQKAEAGCLTGAIVGGIAGHFVGNHGLAGAAAGCAGGAYMKHRRNEQLDQDRYRQYDRNGYRYGPNKGPYTRDDYYRQRYNDQY